MGAPTLSGWIRASGLLAVALGWVLHHRGWRRFHRASTTLATLADPAELVTDDVFALTRNPMYLAGALILFGWALAMGHLILISVAPLFALVAWVLWIRPEEKLLIELFGDSYSAYCQQTRRWI